jgi:hypothetical protein
VRPALPQKSLYYREALPDLDEIQKKTGLGFIPVLVMPEGSLMYGT